MIHQGAFALPKDNLLSQIDDGAQARGHVAASCISGNLTAVTEGPLPTDVLTAIDDAALKAQAKWPSYFFGV